MNRILHRCRLSMLAGIFLLAVPALADEPASVSGSERPVRVIRVLTIGNSFAQNACRYLPSIANSEGSVRLEIGTANLGGCTLERHATLASQSAADPMLRPYTGAGGKKYNLQEYLQSQPWDYVTLQQMSALSHHPESYHPFVDQLADLVKELAPSAQILIHQTWAYRADSPLLKSEGIDPAQMFQGLQMAYAEIAKQYQCSIIPVGAAFQAVRSSAGHEVLAPDPDYDYANPQYPSLPKQTNSLVTGWSWKTKDGKHELSLDFKHGNERGCYLAGLVWFESLTGIDAKETTYLPVGISESDAAFYRMIAHQVVSPIVSPVAP